MSNRLSGGWRVTGAGPSTVIIAPEPRVGAVLKTQTSPKRRIHISGVIDTPPKEAASPENRIADAVSRFVDRLPEHLRIPDRLLNRIDPYVRCTDLPGQLPCNGRLSSGGIGG
jgi:hypothetical protein